MHCFQLIITQSEHRVTSQWRQFPHQISTLNHFSNTVKEHENLKKKKRGKNRRQENVSSPYFTSWFKCTVGVEGIRVFSLLSSIAVLMWVFMLTCSGNLKLLNLNPALTLKKKKKTRKKNPPHKKRQTTTVVRNKNKCFLYCSNNLTQAFGREI